MSKGTLVIPEIASDGIQETARTHDSNRNTNPLLWPPPGSILPQGRPPVTGSAGSGRGDAPNGVL